MDRQNLVLDRFENNLFIGVSCPNFRIAIAEQPEEGWVMSHSSPALPAQRDTVRHLIELAGVALAYLGIVATFAVFSLIACVIWLLIW
ncbi:MAG TPA: hypothetical protein VFJ59_16155 [Pseudolabrys sp.]|nr:hypothetical protein [Pseudolabrys sp.]